MRSIMSLMALIILYPGMAFAQPDVIVGDLPSTNSYGTNAGTGIYAYSLATTSCNIGTANLNWQANNNNHPVIAQDMWRLHEGRFSQIGTSWLKHGFCALQNTGLCVGCGGGGGCLSYLTPGCADPYSAGLNGNQSNLGPRSQVNAYSGFFPYPYNAPPCPPGESTICRRLQVAESDLVGLPGALYFISGQYVASDDANFGNQANNASYRRVNVSSSGNHNLSFVGGTQQEQPGIQAWQDNQPSVTLVDVQVPNEGLFIVGYDVVDNGNGTYNYEYAVYNMYSDRSASSFTIPYPAGATILSHGFRDITWHSGEPYDGTDWAATLNPGIGITWETDSFAQNINANAIRWSMMFNFYFTSDAPPAPNTATMGLFKPGGTGAPTEMSIDVLAPSGNFLPGVQNLSCDLGATATPSVILAWTNPETYTSIVVRRDGATLATLSGGATSYIDVSASYGTSTYSVQAEQGAIPAAQIPCQINILPLPQANFSCSQPDPESSQVQLTWSNGMDYDSISLTRNGVAVATLPGSTTSYSDNGAAMSSHIYNIDATVDGVTTAGLECSITVLPPPPLGFTLTAPSIGAGFDPGTGTGSFSAILSATESTSNTGYPNPVSGYSVALVFDGSLLMVTSLDDSVVPVALDFFDGQFGDGWVTAGAVVSFTGASSLDLSADTNIAALQFNTNPAGLIGQNTDVSASLNWQNGVSGGGLPVDNLIVVGSNAMPPGFIHGEITLSPGAGGTFIRGDINDDSMINIADAVAGLSYLFSGGSATCLDAVDTNDDGQANVADGVYLLSFLFSGGSAPPSPSPGCGADPTTDPLDCAAYASCP
ncbi:MAG: dockerin type I repeat-containing protein [Planctomycetota bacterium]|nr:dockerin type I repeat-containing protein [Planctomycetota bacterium]